jgi:Tfp pilus assembly protein PilO
MRPLHGVGADVPLMRVLAEHRAALFPLAVVVAINLAVLGLVVMPLAQRVSANEARAEAAERENRSAEVQFRQAEAMRDGKARASTDLETFYTRVLPSDVASARRMTQLTLQQKARAHGVQFQRAATVEQELRDSTLRRLAVSLTLSGDYEDIRSFVYELETSPDFLIVDNIELSEATASDELAVAMGVSTYFRAPPPVTARTGSNGR